MVQVEAFIDEAREIGLRDAGRYLQQNGRYPTEDDTDDLGTDAWQAAWADLQGRGATDDLHEGCFVGWRAGFGV